MPTLEELRGAIARGYCTKQNANKIMDSDLCFAMADEVLKTFCKTPLLTKPTPDEVKAKFRGHIWNAINVERKYQTIKWGHTEHSVAEWLLIMETELAEARQAWVKGEGDLGALKELLQVVAVGVACFEEHGVIHEQSHASALINYNHRHDKDDGEMVTVSKS